MKNPGLINLDGVVNLFYDSGYVDLITYRALESGIADCIVLLNSNSSLKTAFEEIKKVVPARGQVVSQASTWKFIHGGTLPSNKVLLSTWAKDNQKVINQFHKHLGSKTRSGSIRQLIWDNSSPGWPGGDGEENRTTTCRSPISAENTV